MYPLKLANYIFSYAHTWRVAYYKIFIPKITFLEKFSKPQKFYSQKLYSIRWLNNFLSMYLHKCKAIHPTVVNTIIASYIVYYMQQFYNYIGITGYQVKTKLHKGLLCGYYVSCILYITTQLLCSLFILRQNFTHSG